jgi:GNAT superfamily N-acetyltransferase
VRQDAVVAETVVVATSEADYAAFGRLVAEYQGWLHELYAGVAGWFAAVAAHQSLDSELANLREKYGPPEGKTLLAIRDGEVVGGVAYRDLHDGSCEMKRMFVPERFQGHGTGRRLCLALIEAATADGFPLMRLDTGFLNTTAMAMYESIGFRMCPAYQDYPADLLVHLRFMELPLPLGGGQD